MARREVSVTITRDGRDQGKTFNLKEMSSEQGEEWACRVLLLIARGGIDVPPYIFQLGFQGFFVLGLGTVVTGLGKAPYAEVKPLMQEMMACVVSMDTQSGVPVTSQVQIANQIEEVATRLQLREEVLSLHLGFSLAARLSEFREMMAATIVAAEAGQNTSTPPDPSESSSQAS